MGIAGHKPSTKESVGEVMSVQWRSVQDMAARAREAPELLGGVGFSQEVTFQLRPD